MLFAPSHFESVSIAYDAVESPPTFCVALTPSFAQPSLTIAAIRSTLKSVEVGVTMS